MHSQRLRPFNKVADPTILANMLRKQSLWNNVGEVLNPKQTQGELPTSEYEPISDDDIKNKTRRKYLKYDMGTFGDVKVPTESINITKHLIDLIKKARRVPGPGFLEFLESGFDVPYIFDPEKFNLVWEQVLNDIKMKNIISHINK